MSASDELSADMRTVFGADVAWAMSGVEVERDRHPRAWRRSTSPTGLGFQNWDTDEPSDRGIEGMEQMRLVHDDINARVHKLLSELDDSPG